MSKKESTPTGSGKPPRSLGKVNRLKGHNAERFYANFFRGLGYKFCKTSRQGSRLLDDCGIDLMHLPFLVQIKAGKQRGLNRIETLKYIETKLKLNFPPESDEHQMPKMLIERKDTNGKRRNQYDDIVSMTVSDFIKITEIIKKQKYDT